MTWPHLILFNKTTTMSKSSSETGTDEKPLDVLPVEAPLRKDYTGKEGYERMNFLYQASMQVLSSQPFNIELVRHYIRCLCDVKEKRVLRWSREMKDTICTGCYMLLVPGVTCTVNKTKHKQTVITCISCRTMKRKNAMVSCKKRRRKKKDKKEVQKRDNRMNQAL